MKKSGYISYERSINWTKGLLSVEGGELQIPLLPFQEMQSSTDGFAVITQIPSSATGFLSSFRGHASDGDMLEAEKISE